MCFAFIYGLNHAEWRYYTIDHRPIFHFAPIACFILHCRADVRRLNCPSHWESQRGLAGGKLIRSNAGLRDNFVTIQVLKSAASKPPFSLMTHNFDPYSSFHIKHFELFGLCVFFLKFPFQDGFIEFQKLENRVTDSRVLIFVGLR